MRSFSPPAGWAAYPAAAECFGIVVKFYAGPTLMPNNSPDNLITASIGINDDM
jgi:hypothetical protein